MKTIPNVFLQVPGYNCFGCAPHNNNGLRLTFTGHDDGRTTTEFTAASHFSGFPGICHGGVGMAVLDELCFWAAFYVYNRFGFTTRMDFRLRRPVPVGEKLIAEARVMSKIGRLVRMSAVIRRVDSDESLIGGEVTYCLADKATWEKVTGGPAHESILPYID